MFQTKNLVHDVKSVPQAWIFEHFLELKQKLTGQDIRMKSLFNPTEKTDSMFIYYKNETYRFKDYSSGHQGSGIDLVKDLKGLSFHTASQLIIERYNDYVLHNNGSLDLQDFKQASKYKVTDHEVRDWTKQDQYFWTQFNIGSKLLEEHCVKPLESYTLTNSKEQLKIRGTYLYGYFKKDGTLYKVYQPKTFDKKFIKVADYIQGIEQCKPGKKYLLITSSLKDIMAIKSLKLEHMNIIAPDSESSVIRESFFDEWVKEYDRIILLFDNDDPGIIAMEKYKKKYPFLRLAMLPMSKDPSDSIRDHGAKKVRERLVPILDRKLQP